MGWFIGVVLVAGGLIWWTISADNAADQAFISRCLQSKMPAAQCEILLEVKRDSRSSRAVSAAAIGFAAGSMARR